MKVDLTLLEQIVSSGKAPSGASNNLDAGAFAALLNQALAAVIDDSGLQAEEQAEGLALFIDQLSDENTDIGELFADAGKEQAEGDQQTINEQFMFAVEMLADRQSADSSVKQEGMNDQFLRQEKEVAATASEINPGEKGKGFAESTSSATAVKVDPDPEKIQFGDKKNHSPQENSLKGERENASRVMGSAEENQALKGRPGVESSEKNPLPDKPAPRFAGDQAEKADFKDLAGQARQIPREKAAEGREQFNGRTGQNEPSAAVKNEPPAGKTTDVFQDKGMDVQNELSSKMARAETVSAKPQASNVPAEQLHINQQPAIQGDHAVRAEAVLQSQDNSGLRQNVMQQLEGKLVYLRESANNPAEMRLTLNPPELGEVTIRVFSRQGKLSASIVAESHLVKEIIESSISELRQRMNFVGIQFEQLDVSTSDGHSGESDRSDGSLGASRPNNPDLRGGELTVAENGLGSQAAVSETGNHIIDYLA